MLATSSLRLSRFPRPRRPTLLTEEKSFHAGHASIAIMVLYTLGYTGDVVRGTWYTLYSDHPNRGWWEQATSTSKCTCSWLRTVLQ
jgi:hypothetical protein